MSKIKRSEIRTFIDTVPAGGLGSETYDILGYTPAGDIDMKPKVESVTYITDDNATVTVEGYNPIMAVEGDCVTTDPVFIYLDGLCIDRATFDDAESTIVNVWQYKTAVSPGVYPAQQQKVAISFEKFGGKGGESAKISYTLNYSGDPIPGTFDTADSSFTAS